MFSKKKFSLFIIVFSFMIMIGVGLRAHFLHDVTKPDGLEFTSEPEITCNIDGWTFTHKHVTNWDGTVLLDFWHKQPTNPEFKIEAKAHGFGWAHITFHGTYDSSTGVKKYGDSKNSTDEQIGSWLNFFPAAIGASEKTIEVSYPGTFSYPSNKYSWSGKGKIKLVPWYWKSALGVPIPVGSWEPAPKEFHTELTDESSGSWTVKRDHKTLTNGSGSGDDDDNEEGDDDEEGENNEEGDTDTPNIGLSPVNPNPTPQPGDSITLNLVTSEPYYDVNWYVKAPWETSERGTYQGYDHDSSGTATEASFSYTFPSGSMHTGDFLITAVIYRHSDMSSYEETYTVTVE